MMFYIIKLLGKRCKFRTRKSCYEQFFLEFLVLFTFNTNLLYFSIMNAMSQFQDGNDPPYIIEESISVEEKVVIQLFLPAILPLPPTAPVDPVATVAPVTQAKISAIESINPPVQVPAGNIDQLGQLAAQIAAGQSSSSRYNWKKFVFTPNEQLPATEKEPDTENNLYHLSDPGNISIDDYIMDRGNDESAYQQLSTHSIEPNPWGSVHQINNGNEEDNEEWLNYVAETAGPEINSGFDQ